MDIQPLGQGPKPPEKVITKKKPTISKPILNTQEKVTEIQNKIPKDHSKSDVKQQSIEHLENKHITHEEEDPFAFLNSGNIHNALFGVKKAEQHKAPRMPHVTHQTHTQGLSTLHNFSYNMIEESQESLYLQQAQKGVDNAQNKVMGFYFGIFEENKKIIKVIDNEGMNKLPTEVKNNYRKQKNLYLLNLITGHVFAPQGAEVYLSEIDQLELVPHELAEKGVKSFLKKSQVPELQFMLFRPEAWKKVDQWIVLRLEQKTQRRIDKKEEIKSPTKKHKKSYIKVRIESKEKEKDDKKRVTEDSDKKRKGNRKIESGLLKAAEREKKHKKLDDARRKDRHEQALDEETKKSEIRRKRRLGKE